ncbi:hypothetical protein INT45_008002 [Circinella minor]|uniref:Pentacotripeptide-repeat region of PRORP domain-containing protein n=1 Tax=Circinella minor TaxID=1195481 RepID=A0A8H7S9Z4_9FUNG|nr:hypothetical protein INT45_008002 [Circinella minor]
MLSRTGTKACLSVGRRRIPISLLRHSLSKTRINDKQQTCSLTTVTQQHQRQQQRLQSQYGHYMTRCHFATRKNNNNNNKNNMATLMASYESEEITNMLTAIQQENILQARKSFSLARNNLNDRRFVTRDMIQNLLMLVRKGEKPADLAFVCDLVETMHQDFSIQPKLFEYHALMYAYGVHERPQDAYDVLLNLPKDIRPSTHTYNILLGCYKRINDYKTALQIFDEMQHTKGARHDLVTYNTMLYFVPQDKALELFEQMEREGIQPDGYTYSTILSIATRANNKRIGNSVYEKLYNVPELVTDTVTMNTMVSYKASTANQGLNDVLDLYHNLSSRFPRIKKNIVTYNIMLDACLKHDNPACAYTIFNDMKRAGIAPDVITYGTLIDAEATQLNMEGALGLFDEMTYRSIRPNERVLGSLANLASRETDPKLLTRVCDTVQRYSQEFRLDSKAYNGLLSGLAKHGRSAQAQELYDEVFRHNTREADVATFTNLMLAYVNDDQLDDAMDIYYELREHYQNAEPGQARITLDTQFYTTLISAMTALSTRNNKNKITSTTMTKDESGPAPSYGYMVEDKPDSVENLDGTSQPSLLRALTLFNDMRRLLIRPNAHVYTAMLYACAQYRDAYALEQIHRLIRMDLYFDPDTAVYNALMDAYNRCGDGHVVLQLWDVLMLSSAPKTAIDQVTISVVLDSCGHNGYSYKAHGIWRKVKRAGFDLNTNNYNSYIECLCRQKGRTGWDEARRVVNEEMRPLTSIHDPRPPLEEKTLNTLIGFARKKKFKQEELNELEAWKQQLLSSSPSSS